MENRTITIIEDAMMLDSEGKLQKCKIMHVHAFLARCEWELGESGSVAIAALPGLSVKLWFPDEPKETKRVGITVALTETQFERIATSGAEAVPETEVWSHKWFMPEGYIAAYRLTTEPEWRMV